MLQGVVLVLEPLHACLHFSGSTVQNTALCGGGDGGRWECIEPWLLGLEHSTLPWWTWVL